jgi:hypothetical protein
MPRAEVVTQKHVNLDQLEHEMGAGAALAGPSLEEAYTTRSKTVACDNRTQQQLEAAVATHKADPDWTPDPELRRIRELGKKAAPKSDDIHEFMALVAKRLR